MKTNSHKNKAAEEIIRIPGGMPRIICAELWSEVNEKMQKNRYKGEKIK